MRILFLGDIELGRYTNDGRSNQNIPHDPWIGLDSMFSKDIDYVIFNLETVISHVVPNCIPNKTYCIISDSSKYLKMLKTRYPHIKFLISTINNHTFDAGVDGYLNTLSTLYNLKMGTPLFKRPFIDDSFIFINATDHWCLNMKKQQTYNKNLELWQDNSHLIINERSKREFIQLVKEMVSIGKQVIVSLHWGRNWEESTTEKTYLTHTIKKFARGLIDIGVYLFFGHGAHHILDEPYEIYNGQLIIYGLGDAMGDFHIRKDQNSQDSLALVWNGSKVDEYKLRRKYIGSQNRKFSIPIII